MKIIRLFLFLLFLFVLTACSGLDTPTLMTYEQSLCRADSLAHTGAADSAVTVKMLADLHREYNRVKELSDGKRVRMVPSNRRKQLFYGILTGLLIGLNVWLSISNIKFKGDRKHSRYLVDLSENEQRLRNNECERTELEECLSEMSLENEEREEVRQSLMNLMNHGNLLHEENESLRLRLKEYEKRPVPREMELLKKEGERVRQLDGQVQALSSAMIDGDELVQQLRLHPKYLADAQWEHLRQLADKVYNDFTRRLTERFPSLTSADLQLCLLIRLCFSNAQMAVFMAVSPATVSQQKFRLKKRLMQMDAEAFKYGKTVDGFIGGC